MISFNEFVLIVIGSVSVLNFFFIVEVVSLVIVVMYKVNNYMGYI